MSSAFLLYCPVALVPILWARLAFNYQWFFGLSPVTANFIKHHICISVSELGSCCALVWGWGEKLPLQRLIVKNCCFCFFIREQICTMFSEKLQLHLLRPVSPFTLGSLISKSLSADVNPSTRSPLPFPKIPKLHILLFPVWVGAHGTVA